MPGNMAVQENGLRPIVKEENGIPASNMPRSARTPQSDSKLCTKVMHIVKMPKQTVVPGRCYGDDVSECILLLERPQAYSARTPFLAQHCTRDFAEEVGQVESRQHDIVIIALLCCQNIVETHTTVKLTDTTWTGHLVSHKHSVRRPNAYCSDRFPDPTRMFV